MLDSYAYYFPYKQENSIYQLKVSNTLPFFFFLLLSVTHVNKSKPLGIFYKNYKKHYIVYCGKLTHYRCLPKKRGNY